jgi:predicted adenine nucleotide alpha hydrolase (AANH) superfamily ATPase
MLVDEWIETLWIVLNVREKTWIELAGMLTISEYQTRIEKKKQLAEALGLNLLVLEDYQKRDLNNLKSKIKRP